MVFSKAYGEQTRLGTRTMLHRGWASDDEGFQVLLEDASLSTITSCHVQSHGVETGGILVGLYARSARQAVVIAASPPPPDSRGGPTWFRRGTIGLAGWLADLWRSENLYYLGEWHSHPGGSCAPSACDSSEMARIAVSRKYHCPEPILVVIGGAEPSHWCLSVSVFRSRQPRVALVPRWRNMLNE